MIFDDNFAYFFIKIYVVEAILMNTHNIGFYKDLTKIIFELSSNTHLISSAVAVGNLKQLCKLTLC